MGVGRRMQKQAAPEPLSEAHYAKLKRKAGLPVDAPTEAPQQKRRRTKAASKSNGAAVPKKSALKKAGEQKFVKAMPLPVENGKAKKSKTQQLIESSDEEEMGDEFDLDDLKEGSTMGDDLLSDNDDDSVFDSDQDANGPRAVFSEDEDDSDLEEKLTAANIVGLSRKLDKKREAEEAADQAELAESALQTNIDKPQVLEDGDSDDELADQTSKLLAPDLQLLRTRITENIRVLDDFANLHQEGRSRAEYTAQLLKDVCAYYGYSEYLAEKLYNLFTPREAFAFFEANESARPVTIRTNTLRTNRRELAQALINRGVTLEPVGKWSKVGLQVFETSVPLGATPEYLAGHYILQAASSFLPCMALDPQEHERVLDMAAAPGGKTTYLAAMMKNTGFVMANDPNKARSKGLIGNIHRLGASNVIVSNYDAREFPKPMGGFDRVLLDAPCSGTGVIAKDPSVKTNKTHMDFLQLPHIQKQLLLAAIDSVSHNSKTGGFICYSTCSVTVEENEEVVQYALRKRPNVELVDTTIPFGKEGFTSFRGKKFDASMSLTRRYYPHTYNVDGFFVAKFQKIGPSPAAAAAGNKEKTAADPVDGYEVVDKTPIQDEVETGDDDFGGFDEDGDQEIIEKGRRNAMRRRGIDPRSNGKKAESKKTESKESKPAETKTAEKKESKKGKSKKGGK